MVRSARRSSWLFVGLALACLAASARAQSAAMLPLPPSALPFPGAAGAAFSVGAPGALAQAAGPAWLPSQSLWWADRWLLRRVAQESPPAPRPRL